MVLYVLVTRYNHTVVGIHLIFMCGTPACVRETSKSERFAGSERLGGQSSERFLDLLERGKAAPFPLGAKNKTTAWSKERLFAQIVERGINSFLSELAQLGYGSKFTIYKLGSAHNRGLERYLIRLRTRKLLVFLQHKCDLLKIDSCK